MHEFQPELEVDETMYGVESIQSQLPLTKIRVDFELWFQLWHYLVSSVQSRVNGAQIYVNGMLAWTKKCSHTKPVRGAKNGDGTQVWC